MPHVTASYDSESEDSPARIILDQDSTDFYILGNPHLTFKLHETPRIPGMQVMALRPVPRPQAVAASTLAMGSGEHGVWTASNFTAPEGITSPQDVFAPRPIKESFGVVERFLVRHRHVPGVVNTPKAMCIFIDGACPDNGNAEAGGRPVLGGCGIVYNTGPQGAVGFPLEVEGPDGVSHSHTNNRAELRAAILALTFRKWWGSGFEKVVLVTDSEYVAKGATEWLRKWASNGWRTASRQPVRNRDLWEKLSEEMAEYAQSGCEISFWAVPRAWNQLADRAAKAAVTQSGRSTKFSGVNGVAC